MKTTGLALVSALAWSGCGADTAWVQRDERWMPRGPWNWAVRDRLPSLWAEFNGIDFGHAHLAETLLRTKDPEEIEKARREVVDFIFSAPQVPPDEDLIAPTFVRLVWEIQKTFNWTHLFHRSLYDLFASDVPGKEEIYRALLADYLEKPEAITRHPLDLHGRLWSFPESKSFRDRFPKFNTQIWAYHWLQAAAYDVQLASLGDPALMRDLFRPVIAFYHGYLRRPPVGWRMMPMMAEAAPEFSRRFPEAARIFDNLHMLHDNVDDVLVRDDLYPALEDKRRALLKIHAMYLHRRHEPEDRHPGLHAPDHAGHGMEGPRPPSVRDVLEGKAPLFGPEAPPRPKTTETHDHGG